MRLLHRANGRLALTADLQEAKGRYAILSHTWLSDEEEVQFDELQIAHHKNGFRKLEFLLDQAEKDGLQYGWADTCCIDKKSNTELGEALNRMFEWYRDAEVCYVYLTDVPRVRFEESRWFTRGWTLQELIAPKVVNFFDNNGAFLGDKNSPSLAHHIEAVTGINQPLSDTPVPERFKWILSRHTKKPEDKSYCMIGLMEIRLMSNYGEGAEPAMDRLLEEVGKEHGKKTERECKRIYAASQFSTEDQLGDVEIRREFLDSLFFEGMFSRQDNIEDPYLDTCTWLLSHDDFVRWKRRQRAFLWIKAKAGAGKSTLMRFATTKDTNAISFFFNARGREHEKSTVGMYRSILWQLAKKMPHLCFSLGEEKVWTVRKLKTTTKQFVLKLLIPLSFYVDALDECKDQEIQDMVYFFHDLSKLSPCFSVCFASRYYPSITVRESIELRLDSQAQHGQDLRSWITGRLDIDGDLREQVIKRANGIFFWAILVVPILNDEISRGNTHNLQARLLELPQDIHKLLEELVSGADKQFSLAMQILLFTKQPLTPEEFYAATMTALGLDQAVQSWRYTHRQYTMLERFLSSSTRGLAETTRGLFSTVQFIHESVRDFLLHRDGMQKIMSGAYSLSNCHNLMKKICHSYLVAADTSGLESYGRTPPFLDYAVRHCLKHAEAAADIDQADFFLYEFDNQKFTEACMKLDRRTSRNRDSSQLAINLLHHFARAGTPRLIETIRSHGSTVDPECVCLAIDAKVPLSLRALLKPSRGSSDTSATISAQRLDRGVSKASVDLNLGTFGSSTAIAYAIEHGSDSSIIQILIEMGADPNMSDNNGFNALHMVASRPNAHETIEYLLSSGVDVNARDFKGRTALMHSLANDKVPSYYKLFLEHNADINVQDANGSSFLMLLVEHPDCPGSDMKQVLQYNPAMELTNQSGKTAIQIAEDHYNFQAVRFLGEAGADTSMLQRRYPWNGEWRLDFVDPPLHRPNKRRKLMD